MRRAMTMLPLLLPLSLLATACSPSPAEKAAQDAKAIAQVEAAQGGKPPATPIAPQPIMFFDITQNKLYGSGCNFVPVDGGMGAVLLAQADRAIIKLADKIVVLAADKGSAKLPQGAWSRYSGKDYALTLTRIEDGKAKQLGVVSTFDGDVVITDPFERAVYTAKGNVQCKPM